MWKIKELINELRTRPWHRTPKQVADELETLFNEARPETQPSTWDRRFIQLAQHVATWSKDPGTQVGAVVIRPDRTIASLGYNGLPRGVTDSRARLFDRGTKLKFVVHAEINAILNARESLKDYTLYAWPLALCSQCAAAVVQVGITRVVTPRCTDTRWRESREAGECILREAGVKQCLIDPSQLPTACLPSTSTTSSPACGD